MVNSLSIAATQKYNIMQCRSDLACKIAIDAVKTVRVEENGKVEIDIKRYAKVEKV